MYLLYEMNGTLSRWCDSVPRGPGIAFWWLEAIIYQTYITDIVTHR